MRREETPMNMPTRWAASLFRPDLAARVFVDRGQGGLGDGLWLALFVSAALYPDWIVRAVLAGWYVGIKAGLLDLALLLRLEFLPAVLVVAGLTALGILAGLVAGGRRVGLGKWFDLAGMAFVAVPVLRLATGWLRLRSGRMPPGVMGWEWYAGSLWAAAAIVWMAVSFRTASEQEAAS